MKRLTFLSLGVLIISILFPIGLLYAQTPAKASLPKVPITYTGDTDETIIRRAKWIEGAKKEGALVWWGVPSPKESGRVIAEFNKVYPFIKVEYWDGYGEEVAARIEAQFIAGRTPVDILQGGEPHNNPRWRKMGALDKFTDIIPARERLPQALYSKYGDWAMNGFQITTPQYNTQKIPAAEAPKSWEDMLNPKWKGKIGVTTDVKVWVKLAVGEGSAWGIPKTEEFLRKLKDQAPIWGRGHSSTHALLVAGEFPLKADAYLRHLFRAREKKAPVEWVRVNPIVVGGPLINLLKKSPNPNAGRLFLEWLFSPQGFARYEEITYYGVIHPGSGSRLAKMLEGLNSVLETEDSIMNALKLGLYDRFAQILGVMQ